MTARKRAVSHATRWSLRTMLVRVNAPHERKALSQKIFLLSAMQRQKKNNVSAFIVISCSGSKNYRHNRLNEHYVAIVANNDGDVLLEAATQANANHNDYSKQDAKGFHLGRSNSGVSN